MRHDLEIQQLRTLVALADRGSFKSAAQALGISQSTVSETLSSLERALGTPVLLRRRGSRVVALTEAGAALLPHAREIVAAVESARIAVAKSNPNARATVPIVANESISTFLLPGALSRVREGWPRVQFPVSIATCEEVRAGVGRGEFDVGLLLEAQAERADPPSSSISATGHVVASDVPLIVFVNPEHRLACDGAGSVVDRADLIGHTLYLSDSAGGFYVLIRRFFESDGLPPPRLEAAGTVEAVKRGVLATSSALGILPRYALADELRSGKAAPLNIRPPPPWMQIEAALSQHRARHPAVTELLRAIRDALGAYA